MQPGIPGSSLCGCPSVASDILPARCMHSTQGTRESRISTTTSSGSLDADISFEQDYFDFLLKKFSYDPQLGVAGTPFREGTVQYDYRFSRKEHVSGACQLFRRECFESIGGYVPLKTGAIDLVAVVTARMKGWKTETFTDKYCESSPPNGHSKTPHLYQRHSKGVW